MTRSKQFFNRRMDQDSENRVLDTGKYRSAKNARTGSSQVSNVGAIESMPSNALLNYTFPSGTNKCIGTCKDVKNTAIIYCFYNSNGNHRIIRWYANTNTFEDILPTTWTVSVLGWTANTRLWNMRIVETGTNQILFFHDVNGTPRRIALNIPQQPSINPRGTGSYTLTEDDISVIRKPPTKAPTWSFEIPNKNINFVNDNNFQFRYRYVYENGEKSVFGPWSELTIPDGNNYEKIQVTFNSGPKGVVKVELSFRVGNGISTTGTENVQEYIWETWDKNSNSDNSNYSADFYYTESVTAVPTNQSSKSFDLVPQFVGAQEIVQSNQVIYGDVTEGYDNPQIDATIETTYESTGIIKFLRTINSYDLNLYNDILPVFGVIHYILHDGSKYVHGYYELSANDLSSFPDNLGTRLVTIFGEVGAIYTYNSGTKTISKSSGNTIVSLVLIPTEQILIYQLDLNLGTSSTASGYVFTATFTECIYRVKLNTRLKMSASAATLTVNLKVNGVTVLSQNINATTSYSDFEIIFSVRAEVGDTISFDITGGSILNAIQTETFISSFYGGISQFYKSGFKLGSSSDFGIVYYDEYLRSSGVVNKVTLSFDYYSDNKTTNQFEQTNPTKGFIGQALTTITSRPPIWARYYQIVTSGTQVLNFEQFIAVDVASVGGKTEIEFDSLGTYNIEVGDVLKIVAISGLDITLGQLSQYTYADTSKVQSGFHKVESFDSGTNKITTDIGFYNESAGNLATAKLIVEIFKPKPSPSQFFFEFGQLYDIGNPGLANRFHYGNVQNQDATDPITTPAIIQTTSGPVWYRFSQRDNVSLGVSNLQIDKFYYLLSYSFSDNRESDYWNKGRPQIETPDQKQLRIKWMYRWGNQLLQDTQVNGMSSFDSGNYGLLSARFGAITGLREIGYTLKMIQELNYNMAFIGRRQIQNADGSTQLVVTDSLIGTVNPSEQLYGCKHPGSILNNGRSLYWVDVVNGVVVRESGNGAYAISSYGMTRYWLNACKSIQENNLEVISGFDSQTESLFITRKKASSLTSADDAHITISFYDPEDTNDEKGWISEHSFDKNVSSTFYPIDMYGSVGSVFTTCLLSGIYRHNEPTSFLNLYGEAKSFKVKSVFNPEADLIKVFLSHWVKMNRIVDGVIFTTPVSQQNPNGMRTLLKPGNYAIKEAAYYAELKNDGYTKGFYADNNVNFIQQLVSGRPMREQIIECEITASGSTIFVLFDHEIGYILSPWT